MENIVMYICIGIIGVALIAFLVWYSKDPKEGTENKDSGENETKKDQLSIIPHKFSTYTSMVVSGIL